MIDKKQRHSIASSLPSSSNKSSLYWSARGSEVPARRPSTIRHEYIDPWDLENYVYIHRHAEVSPTPSASPSLMEEPMSSMLYYRSGSSDENCFSCYAGLDEELFYNAKYESIHDEPPYTSSIYYTDELLADLEDGDVEDIPNEIDEEAIPDEEFMETEESHAVDVDVKVSSIRELCKLHDSQELTNILKQIDHYMEHPRKPSEMVGNVESDPEYQLIVEANSTAVEIDNEISVIHKFTKSHYQKRFPELDSLIVGEMEYMNAVKELGNDLDEAKNNEKLQQILTQATIMIVSVTASTTQGTLLTDTEKAQINEACDMAIDLNNFKLKIYEYVESRMTFIAPNLSMIIGASTAAKILGIAGGLTKLSKMPACNLLVLGSQKKTLSGFSKVQMLPHTGFVYYSQIVQDTNPDLRRKAARLVANKCTLAARVDASHESVHGEIGLRFKEDIEKKLDKLQEPPPVKFAKPLPKPIEGSKKKRGGKRVRKMKERYALTEFRKQANRLNFGDIDEDAYQEDLGYSRGTIGKAGTGRIRLPQVDEKTKVRISKTLHKNMQKQQVYGGSTTVRKQISGTASSVAFTPLQGLEIVNPQAAERSTDTNAKYFSNTSGFLSVGRK